MTTPRHIGTAVKAWRVARGLKQQDLARLAGLSPSTLCGLEYGKHGCSERTLRSLAKALRISPGEVYSPPKGAR
jgi:transcriptional regulator with XRE-family HTH domain